VYDYHNNNNLHAGYSLYRDASMQGGLSHERNLSMSVYPSVHPLSVRVSNTWLWQNERNLCPPSYTTWKNVYLSFPTWRI